MLEFKGPAPGYAPFDRMLMLTALEIIVELPSPLFLTTP